MEEWFSDVNEWALLGFVFVALALAAELGFGIARRVKVDARAPLVMEVQGPVLGLLALLLGFTFSMAAARFETRRELIRDEANMIGTAYLRARLLAEPERGHVQELLRRYVDTRLELQDKGYAPEALRAIDRKSATLHQQLWLDAMTEAERDSRSVMTGLFVSALNEVIDMHATQVAAIRNRIPVSISLLLFLVALVAMGLTGYGSGAGHVQSTALCILLSGLIALVLFVIVDLHRPARGLVRASTASMMDLRDALHAEPH